jgi:hypothetical protein
MHSKIPPRNRLAKVLPQQFREQLAAAGIPKRKYTAILRATLTDGSVIEEMVVEEGWIVGLDRAGLVGKDDRHISLDPRQIVSVEVVQSI